MCKLHELLKSGGIKIGEENRWIDLKPGELERFTTKTGANNICAKQMMGHRKRCFYGLYSSKIRCSISFPL